MEEKQEAKAFHGVMIGLMTDDSGAPFVGFNVNGSMIAMTPDMALTLMDQLGAILDSLGMFDDEDEPVEEKRKCH